MRPRSISTSFSRWISSVVVFSRIGLSTSSAASCRRGRAGSGRCPRARRARSGASGRGDRDVRVGAVMRSSPCCGARPSGSVPASCLTLVCLISAEQPAPPAATSRHELADSPERQPGVHDGQQVIPERLEPLDRRALLLCHVHSAATFSRWSLVGATFMSFGTTTCGDASRTLASNSAASPFAITARHNQSRHRPCGRARCTYRRSDRAPSWSCPRS